MSLVVRGGVEMSLVVVGWPDHWNELVRSVADRPTQSCFSARPPC
jgi:hypothetical protein